MAEPIAIATTTIIGSGADSAQRIGQIINSAIRSGEIQADPAGGVTFGRIIDGAGMEHRFSVPASHFTLLLQYPVLTQIAAALWQPGPDATGATVKSMDAAEIEAAIERFFNHGTP